MGEPAVCPWCSGGSRHSDWGPYCSPGCEHNAVLAQARAEGAAAERAAVVAFLRAQAEAGGDPWMSHVAYEVEAGLHQVVSE